ncbi:MAG: 2-oxoglutarate dehydrogenase complex dihydrolipoyllysine-residue succinyltransferase [Planctomycetia bacterium]|nr:2-oxoglutarate dehydrogenase complex dihydrolipoyllysine-residue succinyltransferase [Planctomycetia bacterium]
MSIPLKVPAVGESITEVQIGQWFKQPGQAVRKDEVLAEIESDKATVELVAPEAGVLEQVLRKQGEIAKVGEVIGQLAPQGATTASEPAQPAPEPAATPSAPTNGPAAASQRSPAAETTHVMPSARRALAEQGIPAERVPASGPGGRLLKEDVDRYAAAEREIAPAVQSAAMATVPSPTSTQVFVQTVGLPSDDRGEEIVPMSPLRQRVAQRLVEAQQAAALLTTFNEVDMSAVMALRKTHQESFQKKHGVKVGFMSFFIKATIEALKSTPQLNAEIRGTTIAYRNYYDIGVAVSGGKGLVVPILRNVERMSFAEIELAIADFGARARENKIGLAELQGGTFTISNGGVFGSMLSTPIVNPPQSGILGLHAIQDRPVARDGQVVIRPMMYLALTYDHRIVDGREAVTFLKQIKELVEEPSRILLEL